MACPAARRGATAQVSEAALCLLLAPGKFPHYPCGMKATAFTALQGSLAIVSIAAADLPDTITYHSAKADVIFQHPDKFKDIRDFESSGPRRARRASSISSAMQILDPGR